MRLLPKIKVRFYLSLSKDEMKQAPMFLNNQRRLQIHSHFRIKQDSFIGHVADQQAIYKGTQWVNQDRMIGSMLLPTAKGTFLQGDHDSAIDIEITMPWYFEALIMLILLIPVAGPIYRLIIEDTPSPSLLILLIVPIVYFFVYVFWLKPHYYHHADLILDTLSAGLKAGPQRQFIE
ncbi:MAG: hypothetical protein ACKVOR_09335 [Flavobacteriales bacterium]